MAKLKGQLFARLALDYFDHPKIMRLSSEAIVAHLEMIVYSRKYGTDGAIPMRFAMRFASAVLDELASNDESAPSIVRCEDGSVEIYGYANMQETSYQIAERRQKRKEAGAAGANARWQKNANGNANRIANRMKIACESDSKKMAETETETETYIGQKSDALFESFWGVYPRRIAKKEAMRKAAEAEMLELAAAEEAKRAVEARKQAEKACMEALQAKEEAVRKAEEAARASEEIDIETKKKLEQLKKKMK